MKKIVILVLSLLCITSVFATDLFEMVEIGDIKGIKQAVLEGADVNALDVEGVSPLLYAILYIYENATDDYRIIETLLNAGADINQQIRTSYDEVFTPLSLAVMLFIDYYEPNVKNRFMNYGLIAYLIEQGAHGNVRVEGYPILIAPLVTGSPDIAALMMQSGADVNARSYSGQTVLSYFLEEIYDNEDHPITDSHYEVFSMLLDAGLNVNAWDKNGMNALMHAAENHDERMVRFLLNSGADPKLISPDGETAFTYGSHNQLLAGTDTFGILCDAHYQAMDMHINAMQQYFIL